MLYSWCGRVWARIPTLAAGCLSLLHTSPRYSIQSAHALQRSPRCSEPGLAQDDPSRDLLEHVPRAIGMLVKVVSRPTPANLRPVSTRNVRLPVLDVVVVGIRIDIGAGRFFGVGEKPEARLPAIITDRGRRDPGTRSANIIVAGVTPHNLGVVIVPGQKTDAGTAPVPIVVLLVIVVRYCCAIAVVSDLEDGLPSLFRRRVGDKAREGEDHGEDGEHGGQGWLLKC